MNVYPTKAKVNSFFRAFPLFGLALGSLRGIGSNPFFINKMFDRIRHWLFLARTTLPAILLIIGKLAVKPNHFGYLRTLLG
jgi:hypothetical protein